MESLAFRDWHVEAAEGRRDKTIGADEVDQLIRAVLAEGLDSEAVEWLG